MFEATGWAARMDSGPESTREWVNDLSNELDEKPLPANPKAAYGDKKLAMWAVPPALIASRASGSSSRSSKAAAAPTTVS